MDDDVGEIPDPISLMESKKRRFGGRQTSTSSSSSSSSSGSSRSSLNLHSTSSRSSNSSRSHLFKNQAVYYSVM